MLAAEQTHPSASLASAQRSVLRLLTCGSVDDGKSTLIGRLLFDCKAIPEDQLAVLERDSKRIGTTGGKIDFALLVDGLETERQQGITIDVAYRYFRTDKRAFVIADTPGHEQYTRNMATGASTASLAILLVDARKGLLTQTKRHSRICACSGVKHIVVAVNKLDLMDFSQEVFRPSRRVCRVCRGLRLLVHSGHSALRRRWRQRRHRIGAHAWYCGSGSAGVS
jgi:small GTP-binding protein